MNNQEVSVASKESASPSLEKLVDGLVKTEGAAEYLGNIEIAADLVN